MFPGNKASFCIRNNHVALIGSNFETMGIKPINLQKGIVIRRIMEISLQNSTRHIFKHPIKSAPFLIATCLGVPDTETDTVHNSDISMSSNINNQTTK